jgi:charged multivesicular body protein 7
MLSLLDYLQTHEEQFRKFVPPVELDPRQQPLTTDSRARLASLYSDFRVQRTTNPDGYAANVSAWLVGLSHAAKDHALPEENGTLALKTGESLLRALETKEHGRPLALGAVIVGIDCQAVLDLSRDRGEG